MMLLAIGSVSSLMKVAIDGTTYLAGSIIKKHITRSHLLLKSRHRLCARIMNRTSPTKNVGPHSAKRSKLREVRWE